MQGWRGCASLATPTGAGFTQGPTLIDMRDNKQYEIRKFSDGKCWMVDNLMYGGDVDVHNGMTDNCNGKSTFAGNGSATPSHQFGPGTYGDCLDPRIRNKAPCTTNSTTCGYFYNWQAIMQHPDAYYGGSYTGSGMNVKGLCPDGWRLPTYNDFITLHTLANSPAMGFWQTPGNWKGVFAGLGGGSFIGTEAIYWSSTPYNYNIDTVYGIHVPSTYTVKINNYIIYINDGYNVRCLRN